MEQFLKQFHLSGIIAPELSDSEICLDAGCNDNCTADCPPLADGC
jgi:hypothetical protein